MSPFSFRRPLAGFCVAALAAAALITTAHAQPVNFVPAPKWFNPFAAVHQTLVSTMQANARTRVQQDVQASTPPNGQTNIQANVQENIQDSAPADAIVAPTKSASRRDRLRRQIVAYQTSEGPGTIVIDTANTYLYLVLGNGKALRYGIGVGRKGFTWSGIKTVGRKAKWPDWVPPSQMLKRQPYLPRFVAGGPRNPLGARAMYLAGTVYRIHGTNAPSSIGKHMSSGCIRMLNADVIDLYERVKLGTKVVVLPDSRGKTQVASR